MLQAIAMSKVNIRTEEGQRLIEEYQIYSKAREDFFKDTEKHLV
jgi:molybdenum-dependent DNA-binding transcriptional regulator ModE